VLEEKLELDSEGQELFARYLSEDRT